MAKPSITLYIDIVSPFGYMAYWFLRNSPIFQSCDIKYVPILLGGVMKACGNTPPIAIKNKDKWIGKERERWAHQFNIPMRPDVPPNFPPSTVTAGRVLCAVELKAPEKLVVAADRLETALWAPDALKDAPSPKGTEYDTKNPEVIAALLSHPSVLGKDLTKSVMESIGSAEVKAQLTKNTEEALRNGAFGLPWFWCTNAKGVTEGFWGFDHLGQVVRFLELDGQKGDVKVQPML